MATSSQPGQPPSSQTTSQPPHVDTDPITKFKLLVPRLKESLVNLMKIAGQSLNQNAFVDDGYKGNDGIQQRFERSLEEFYSICDQIEVTLRFALETNHQVSDSVKYSPLPVNLPKSDNQLPEGQSISYSQYLTTVKHQISCATEIHELLVEHARKLSEMQ